ncbi:hypothetical protein P389DRAFT_194595 [Cystobasidium minutum MCA 4210]|uniref:uncharacterized protein n=1 Tax=Cystobasidium minutum MCA 4210 TaxID=1397322 RepID=UPI0034CE1FCF|eukprot:jgi/Rhomi1/194595/gm1.2809_g
MDEWRVLADALKADISTAAAVTAAAPEDQQRGLTTRLLQLKKHAEENYESLPAYERRRQADIIAELEDSLKKLQQHYSTSAVSSKFAFARNRKAATAPVKHEPNNQINAFVNTETRPSGTPVNKIRSTPIIADKRVLEQGLTGEKPSSENSEHATKQMRTLEYITLASLDDTSTSVSLNSLDRCIVDLTHYSRGSDNAEDPQDSIPALYLENISNCLVIAPDIKGSALIHNAQNCIFILKCHQFRMHTSSNVKVVIETDSTPIIEKCTRIKFASSLSSLTKEAPLDILDFDKPDIASETRNWKMMDDEQEVKQITELRDELRRKKALMPDEIEELLQRAGLERLK